MVAGRPPALPLCLCLTLVIRQQTCNQCLRTLSLQPVSNIDSCPAALQVSIECSPEQLLEYLHSADAAAVSVAAGAAHQAKQEEERLLEAASNALGTQYLIRFISRHKQPDICSSLERLISHAAAVRQTFDMSGEYPRVCLAVCPNTTTPWRAMAT